MIRYYCGCGWTHPARDINGHKEALEHVVMTGHVVGANGYIRPEDVGVPNIDRRAWTHSARNKYEEKGGDTKR